MNLLEKLFGGIKTDFVSPIDQFLIELDQKYSRKSRSQQREIKQFKRIYYLRDHVVHEDANKLWEGF